MRGVTLLGLALVALTAAALLIGLSYWNAMGDPLGRWAFRSPIVLSLPVYFAAVWLVLKRGARPSLGLILAVAVTARLILLASPPMLSSDIFRYVWDGRVQGAGINPYLYLPVDPALKSLRDSAIYPHINRADYAPTIYPPAAQALFAAVAAISPTVVAMKTAMVAMEALAVACLLRLLARTGQPAANILIYAWNPLAIWEFAGNGHVDAAAIGLLALALLLRAQRNSLAAGVALGGAILVKFLPAVAAPALWRRGTPGFRVAAGALVCITALYGFYFVFGGAGMKVLGFLGAYGGEEGIDTGTGIWALAGLATIAPLPDWAPKLYLALAALLLMALGAWVALRPRPPAGTAADILRVSADTGMLAFCVMVAISPHYSWYFVWLAVPAVVVPRACLIWLSAGALLLYQNALPDRFFWPSLVFAPAIILACLDLRSARATHSTEALQGSI